MGESFILLHNTCLTQEKRHPIGFTLASYASFIPSFAQVLRHLTGFTQLSPFWQQEAVLQAPYYSLLAWYSLAVPKTEHERQKHA